jgi:glucose-1-phosphate adenylyltransferase
MILMSNPNTKILERNNPKQLVTKKILSYQYEGYWTDIGNIDSF